MKKLVDSQRGCEPQVENCCSKTVLAQNWPREKCFDMNGAWKTKQNETTSLGLIREWRLQYILPAWDLQYRLSNGGQGQLTCGRSIPGIEGLGQDSCWRLNVD